MTARCALALVVGCATVNANPVPTAALVRAGSLAMQCRVSGGLHTEGCAESAVCSRALTLGIEAHIAAQRTRATCVDEARSRSERKVGCAHEVGLRAWETLRFMAMLRSGREEAGRLEGDRSRRGCTFDP